MRHAYSNGEIRPLARGFLHLMATVLLAASLCACLYAQVHWQWVAMLIAKTLSYGSSALYHLYPNKDAVWEERLLILDMLCITPAMWAPMSLFTNDIYEYQVSLVGMIAATGLNLQAILFHLNHDTRRPNFRVSLLTCYGSLQIFIIGWHVNFTTSWWLGALLYAAASYAAPPFCHLHTPAPWHWAGVYGWHEDFHVCLFLADNIYIWMGLGRCCQS